MKKKSNLYQSMISFNEVVSVYKKLRCSTKNKKEVIDFSLNLNQFLLDILRKLNNRCYSFGRYRIFLIREPKYRLIMSEKMSDKIVNHLFTKVCLGCLENRLVSMNVATRKDKGSKEAYNLFIKYINKLMYKSKDIYVLKIDISKYFYNINHEILLDMVKEKIKDKEVISFLSYILDSTNLEYVNNDIRRVVSNEKFRVSKKNISEFEKKKLYSELDSIPTYKSGYGLPIGNYSSQILAVFYLNKVDHFIKESLGCKYYVRYMDDLVIMDTDKEKLKSIFSKVSEYISSFDLVVNKKSGIYKLKEGINFLGYNFKVSKGMVIRYRSDTIKRVNKKLKNLRVYDIDMYNKSYASYKGYFVMCNTSIRDKYLSD